MFIMKSVILKGQDDLEAFRKHVSESVGVSFPIKYLNQGQVRGFKNKDGKLVGGYALITKGPLRTIQSLPDCAECSHKEEDLLEVTALWLDKSLKSGVFSGQFWIQFSKDIYTQYSKSHIIYAYDLDSIKLQKLYALAKPEIIYRGRVKKLIGNSYAGIESVEVATRKRVSFLPLYVLPNFLNKVFFKRTPVLKDVKIFSYLNGGK